MKQLLIIVFLTIPLFLLFPHENEIFKGKNSQLYGLKNIESGEIIFPPNYKHIFNYQDTIILLTEPDRTEGWMNLYGDTIVVFKKEATSLSLYYCCGGDSLLYYQPMSFPYRINNKLNGTYIFIIDKNRNCITNDYYPCPPEVTKTENTNTDKYLLYIDRSIEMSEEGNYDSTYILINKAIELNPNNPFPYYWLGKIFIDCRENGLTGKNNEVIEKYIDSIEESLIKADKLEKITGYRILIKKVQKKFYRYEKKNKKMVKKIKYELKELRDTQKQIAANCKW